MKAIIPVAESGQLTLPDAIREQLGLARGGEVELDLTDGLVVMRTVDRLSEEEKSRIRRGQDDVRAGRVRQMSEEEIEGLIDQA